MAVGYQVGSECVSTCLRADCRSLIAYSRLHRTCLHDRRQEHLYACFGAVLQKQPRCSLCAQAERRRAPDLIEAVLGEAANVELADDDGQLIDAEALGQLRVLPRLPADTNRPESRFPEA